MKYGRSFSKCHKVFSVQDFQHETLVKLKITLPDSKNFVVKIKLYYKINIIQFSIILRVKRMQIATVKKRMMWSDQRLIRKPIE